MRVIIEGYNIDINVESVKNTTKAKWVKDRVKSFLFTGINKKVLELKFSDVFDLCSGR